MRFSSLLSLPLCLLDVVQSTYLSEFDDAQATLTAGPRNPTSGSWNLSEPPSLNSTANFLFDTVNSFLQHWPNTRLRNGHNVVPGTVPVGTMLYHAPLDHAIPTTPEWVAVDPEHSYYFCSMWSSLPDDDERSKRPCWHLTMVTTPPLKVLYFDGSSAVNLVGGPFDIQDLLTWGKVDDSKIMAEWIRIEILCEWGKKYGLDGFVRRVLQLSLMEMDFEIMLCDFTAGVKPVSFLNLISRSSKRPPSSTPPHSDSIPTIESESPRTPFGERAYRVIESGSWADRYPGDARFQLDYSRLLSFYDVDSFPSVHASRKGQERWDHRAGSISPEDTLVFLEKLDGLLSVENNIEKGTGSGVDWRTLFHVIETRFAERLEVLEYILDSEAASAAEEEAVFENAFNHARSMIIPYVLHSAVPPRSSRDGAKRDWAVPVYKLCTMTHTDHLNNSDIERRLTPSEKLLRDAATGVSKEICRVLVNIWADGEEIWARSDSDPTLPRNVSRYISSWRSSISNLKAWLDWSVWVRCRPACRIEEKCYLPTWPFFGWKPKLASRFASSLGASEPLTNATGFGLRSNKMEWLATVVDGSEGKGETARSMEEWKHPQPWCIRRVAPFTKFENGF